MKNEQSDLTSVESAAEVNSGSAIEVCETTEQRAIRQMRERAANSPWSHGDA